MNKEQKELLSDAYNMFQKTCQFEEDANHILPDKWMTMSNDFMNAGILSQEEFTNKIKIDIEFAKQWGVVYEERELSLQERYQLLRANGLCPKYTFEIEDEKPIPNKLSKTEWYDKYNIPKLAITITYNNKTIESYEFI